MLMQPESPTTFALLFLCVCVLNQNRTEMFEREDETKKKVHKLFVIIFEWRKIFAQYFEDMYVICI